MTSEVFNLIEAIAWSLLGIGCFVYAKTRLSGFRRKLLLLAGVNLLVFAASDLYEIRTGAWWDPVWLLVLKALCIAGFIVLYALYRKVSRKDL